MAILNFMRRPDADPRIALPGEVSIEVIPRTAAKIADFTALLPAGTRVYVAHIDGTPIDDMIATARRLRDEGFEPMPHIPARMIRDRCELDTWLSRYSAEAGATQALVLAGGLARSRGEFENSMQLLETGLFDSHGFRRLHVAGHPEGNAAIDADNPTQLLDDALRWKAAFAARTGARMALVTQFVFEAEPVLTWARRLNAEGVDLPIHVGVAGPARLQTLIRFALACGIGPSLKVLERRAKDLTNLVRPFEPTRILSDLSGAHASGRAGNIEAIHVFPLGGIAETADYLDRLTVRATDRRSG